jgi:hypothetical protein
MALHRVQCRAATSSTGKTRKRRLWGERRNRAITPQSRATMMMMNTALRMVLSIGGQLKSSSAPRLPSAKLSSHSML